MTTKNYRVVHPSWDLPTALDALGLPQDGVFNAAFVCCDRHPPHQKAITCLDDAGVIREHTFGELADCSRRLASVLQKGGVGTGDKVSVMLPKGVEQVIALLAVWRLGAVYQPLFTAFGPKAIEHRVTQAEAKYLIVDADHVDKLKELTLDIPILAVATASHPTLEHSFWSALRQAEPFAAHQDYGPEHPLLMMFTSGTTGLPKGLLVPNKALLSFATYALFGMGLTRDSVYWNIADPGWAYGLYYACAAPMALGFGVCLYTGAFSTTSFARAITTLGVTHLAGSPTAYRMLMADASLDTSALRGRLKQVSSAGEPLNPEVIRWFERELGSVIHDHYGQTETGMVLCNHHGLQHPVEHGTTGLALPGFRLDVIDKESKPCGPGVTGDLALHIPTSALFWFSGYSGTRDTRSGEWYRTGDLVQRNVSGTVSFVGRGDDIITSSGYRIGPFDVESALLEHAAVAEAAAVGLPDPERTEIVAGFVVLKAGQAGTPELAEELRIHVRERLSAHAYPRRILFVESLPKTPSGKIQRFMLRNQHAH